MFRLIHIDKNSDANAIPFEHGFLAPVLFILDDEKEVKQHSAFAITPI